MFSPWQDDSGQGPAFLPNLRPRRSLFQRLTNRRVVPRVVYIGERLSETPFVLSPSRIRGWELVAGGREEVAGRAMIRVVGDRIDAAASLGPVSQVSAIAARCASRFAAQVNRSMPSDDVGVIGNTALKTMP
jgi:hypothetical protein